MKLGSCQRRRSSLVEKVGHGTKSSQSGTDESPPPTPGERMGRGGSEETEGRKREAS